MLALTRPTVAATCDTPPDPPHVSATTVAFGTYLVGTGSSASGTVTVACSSDAHDLPSFTVALSKGLYGSFNPRQMGAGTYRLNFDLYTNSSHTLIWGDGTGGSVTESYGSSAKVGHISFTAYGLVPASQSATPGSYADTITVTVTY
jgi:spore coat protein U-like protein